MSRIHNTASDPNGSELTGFVIQTAQHYKTEKINQISQATS